MCWYTCWLQLWSQSWRSLAELVSGLSPLVLDCGGVWGAGGVAGDMCEAEAIYQLVGKYFKPFLANYHPWVERLTYSAIYFRGAGKTITS